MKLSKTFSLAGVRRGPSTFSAVSRFLLALSHIKLSRSRLRFLISYALCWSRIYFTRMVVPLALAPTPVSFFIASLEDGKG